MIYGNDMMIGIIIQNDNEREVVRRDEYPRYRHQMGRNTYRNSQLNVLNQT